ncbi:MAG: alkaline phosphatase [Pseudomonadota bacterium]
MPKILRDAFVLLAAFILWIPALEAQVPKSLVISVDGMGYGTQGFDEAATPWMDSLINGTWHPDYRGAYSDSAYSGGVLGTPFEQGTISGPGWSTIQTGVWTDRHGVTGNGSSFTNGDFTNNPPYIGLVKSADPSLITASFVNWGPIDSIIMEAVDTDADPNNDLDIREDLGNDSSVASTAAATISSTLIDADVVFVAFDEVDLAGHASGSSFALYREAIESADVRIGELLDALAARPDFDNEYWQIIVTSDHGHRPNGGHGSQTSLERTIPFIVVSRTLRHGNLPSGVSHADVAPTVLDHFGVSVPPHIVGVRRSSGAIQDVAIVDVDDFEGLNLVPFTNANAGDGSDWTSIIGQGPALWTIDNSQMEGTTTEQAYNGWTAMDVDSWIDEQGVQIGRSTLATSIGNTVLVADPDAWEDFTTGAGAQGYNSYISRHFDLTGIDRSRLRLEFDYEFVTEDTQAGFAELSFDNGTTWQRLLEFDSATVPDNTFFVGPGVFDSGIDFSATSDDMLLRFGCFDAGNDWWFAVDNIILAIPQDTVTQTNSFQVTRGVLAGGGLAALEASDNIDLTIQRDPLSPIGEISIEFETISAYSDPSRFEFTLESSAFFRSEIVQSIEFYDFDADEFVQIDQRNASRSSDITVTASGTGDLSRFVEDVTGVIRARVFLDSAISRQRFSTGIDKSIWIIE